MIYLLVELEKEDKAYKSEKWEVLLVKLADFAEEVHGFHISDSRILGFTYKETEYELI